VSYPRANVCTIIEYYAEGQSPTDENTTLVMCTGLAVPMAQGGEYLLFLEASSHSYGDYESVFCWMGRYKVSDALEDPGYWAMAQEVKEKYIDEP
jgi:hypothetical protein